MMQDVDSPAPKKPQATEKQVREARRKEALKANMARRKAQVRARGDVAEQTPGTDTTSGPNNE